MKDIHSQLHKHLKIDKFMINKRKCQLCRMEYSPYGVFYYEVPNKNKKVFVWFMCFVFWITIMLIVMILGDLIDV